MSQVNKPGMMNNRVIMIAAAAIGLIDSIYLLVIKITDNKALCLQGVGDCYGVNSSVYSEIFGIPVSVFGIGAYLLILALIGFEKFSPNHETISLYSVFGITLAGLLYSIYLTYIELFVLKAVCPFCVVSALVMLLLFALAISRLLKMTGEANS